MNVYVAGLGPGQSRRTIEATNRISGAGHFPFISTLSFPKDNHRTEDHLAIMKQCDALILLNHPLLSPEVIMAKQLGRISIFHSVDCFLANLDFLKGLDEADRVAANMGAMPVEVSPDMPQEVADVMRSETHWDQSEHFPGQLPFETSFSCSFCCPHCGGSISLDVEQS